MDTLAIEQMLFALAANNIKVNLRQGKLVFEGNLKAIDAQQKAIIVENKDAIIGYLNSLTNNEVASIPLRSEQSDNLLSFAQQRLWILDNIEEGSAHYNMPNALKLSGRLNLIVVKQAFLTIIKRHESLRTCFVENDMGQARQVIQSVNAFDIPVIDLSDDKAVNQEIQLTQFLEEEASKVFDLSQDLMLRAKLLKYSESEHVLLVTMHHIASDGWSMSILVNEFSALYKAYILELANPLPPLAIQYADYADWQRTWLQGEVLNKQLAYWRQQLAELPAVHNLALDKPRPKIQTHNGKTVYSVIDKVATAKANDCCKNEGATLFMALHATFSALLSRYSNETDIVVGTPIANREQEEVAGLIGFFVNTLVLRSNLAGNPTFKALLKQSKKMLLDAYAHQQVPFEQIVDQLQPERNQSHSPLFQVMLALQNNAQGTLALPDLTLSPVASQNHVAKFDLSVNVEESEQGLQVSWEYNTDLFHDKTIADIAESFTRLFTDLVNNPDKNIADAEMLSKQAIKQQLIDWNDTQAPYANNSCIHELFEQQVNQHPEAIALAFEQQTLTYGQLNNRANQLAHYLIKEKKVSPDTLVGLCVERSFEMMIGLLAIIKAGGAYVPIDPTYPEARISFILADSGVELMLTQSSLKNDLPESTPQLLCIDETDVYHSYPTTNVIAQDIRLTAQHLAYVIYTSGSTGQPKGSLLSHQGLCNLVQAQSTTFEVIPSSCVLQFASIAFDAATSEWAMALCCGATLGLVSSHTLTTPAALDAAIADMKVTHATLPPALLPALTLSAWQGVSHLIVAGDSCAWELAQLWSTGRNFYNAYGPSEVTVCSTINRFDPAESSLHIGKPINNIQAYVIDSNNALCPVGVSGELHIGGVGLSRGYLNNPSLTAEKFISNPYYDKSNPASSKRLYKTGDLVRWLPNGNLTFMGRIDHQVKIRGFRIELGEIEHNLIGLDQIDDAIVLVKERESKEKYLVAYLLTETNEVTEDFIARVKASLSQKLPDYMVPSIFVLLDAFPLTANGKVDRKALPDANGSGQEQHQHVEPTTDIEQQLCLIWQRLLGKEKIGITDNFYNLGGDSILSIQLVSQANQVGIKLTTRQIFAHQTIQELALHVDMGVAIIAPQEAIEGQQILLPIHRQFFNDTIDKHHFNQSVLLKIPEGFELEDLALLIEAICTRHDVLRLNYHVNNDEWVARYQPYNEDLLTKIMGYEDLTGIPETDRIARQIELGNAIQQSLSLEQGLLFRAVYIKADGENSRLALVIHHLVVDGVSWRILLQDFEQGLQTLKQKKAVQLSPKTSSFQQWGKWLSDYVDSELLQSEKAYWLQQLSIAVPLLPVDNESADDNSIATTQSVRLSLTEQETNALLVDCHHKYNTEINDLLLAAVAMAIYRWCGNTHLRIDMEGHGREELSDELNMSETLGWFTSCFPATFTLSDPNNIGSVVNDIKTQLSAIPNKGIGYGLLHELDAKADVRLASKGNESSLVFNYLGQFDQLVDENRAFPVMGESLGESISHRRQRKHLIGLNGLVADKCLSFELDFNKNQYKEVTMVTLANEIEQALKAIIEHCQHEKTVAEPEILPLTPAQYWFFELENITPHHFNWSEMNELNFEVDAKIMQLSIAHIIARHESLRSRFMLVNNRWMQTVDPIKNEVPFEYLDYSSLNTKQQDSAIKALVNTVQTSLNYETGDVVRFSLVNLGMQRPTRLLIAFHHLAVDGYSMGFFRQELFTLYQLLSEGKPILLPPESTSYAESVKRLAAYANSATIKHDIPYWQSQLANDLAKLPTDISEHKLNDEGSSCFVYGGELGVAESDIVLKKIPSQYKIQNISVIISAIALAVGKWTKQKKLLIDIGQLGRDFELEQVDLSRTLGWYAVPYPLFIDFEDCDSNIELLTVTEQKLMNVPNSGASFSLLKYLSEDSEVVDMLVGKSSPEIGLNFIATDSKSGTTQDIVTRVGDADGTSVAPENINKYKLDFWIGSNDGQLGVSIKYSRNLYKHETVEALMHLCVEQLKNIADDYLAESSLNSKTHS